MYFKMRHLTSIHINSFKQQQNQSLCSVCAGLGGKKGSCKEDTAHVVCCVCRFKKKKPFKECADLTQHMMSFVCAGSRRGSEGGRRDGTHFLQSKETRKQGKVQQRYLFYFS